MQPRRFEWRCLLTSEEKQKPGADSYVRGMVRNRLRDIIADESINISTRERKEPGGVEYSASLYVLTETEIREFVKYINQQAAKGLPVFF